MSRHSGPQHRGAAREAHTERRLEAEARADAAPATRRQPTPIEIERDCS